MGGLWPAIYLEYQGTKVKIQEGTPPTVAELEHEISENELIFHPMHNQNVVVEVNEEDVNKIIITLRGGYLNNLLIFYLKSNKNNKKKVFEFLL
jgi:hypothetical protein